MWMIFREAETRKPVKQEGVVKAELPQAWLFGGRRTRQRLGIRLALASR